MKTPPLLLVLLALAPAAHAQETRAVPTARVDVADSRQILLPPPGPPVFPLTTTVAIAATVPDAYEASAAKGIFTVSRTADASEDTPLAALTVSYLAGGTAIGGVQYRVLPGTVTIPAGQTQAVIKVKPLNDGGVGGESTVKITLSPGVDYLLGSAVKAKVKIHDAPAVP